MIDSSGQIAVLRNGGRLPRSRAAALRIFRRVVLATSMVSLAALAAGRVLIDPARCGPPNLSTWLSFLIPAFLTVFVPSLLLSMTGFAERRLVGRPPKALLAQAYALLLLGLTAVVAGALGLGTEPQTLQSVGHVSLFFAAGLLALWLFATLIVVNSEEQVA